MMKHLYPPLEGAGGGLEKNSTIIEFLPLPPPKGDKGTSLFSFF